MVTRQSQDIYLEAIYTIREQTGRCRSVDVADYLGYSKPSVSVACRKLRDKELLQPKTHHGELILTKEGAAIGKSVAARHRFFREWLVSIGVDEVTAARDACGLDHMISEGTVEKLKAYIKAKK